MNEIEKLRKLNKKLKYIQTFEYKYDNFFHLSEIIEEQIKDLKNIIPSEQDISDYNYDMIENWIYIRRELVNVLFNLEKWLIVIKRQFNSEETEEAENRKNNYE